MTLESEGNHEMNLERNKDLTMQEIKKGTDYAVELVTSLFGHYNLLQFLALAKLRHTSRAIANFGYPALIHPLSPGRPNAGEAVLFCDFHHRA